MLARGSVVAAASSEGNLPQFEVGEELVPFGGGEFAVFLPGPLGAASGDEGPVVRDYILGVDRSVSHGCVHCAMAPAAVIWAACDMATRHSRM